MSVVYEKLLLLTVAAATKWIFAFLIDIYIYTYIKNIRNVRKRKYDEKTVVTTFGGLFRQRILNIRTSGIYIYIFQFLHLQRKPPQQAYLPDLMYIQITHPFHLPTNFLSIFHSPSKFSLLIRPSNRLHPIPFPQALLTIESSKPRLLRSTMRQTGFVVDAHGINVYGSCFNLSRDAQSSLEIFGEDGGGET